MFSLIHEKDYAHLTFQHEKGNPIDLLFVQHFFDTLNGLDESVKVLVIEGLPHFSVGMNLKTLREMKVTEVETLFSIYEQLLYKLETASYITLAKITGYALGAGAELALACDFRFMEQKAKIGFPGVNVGFAYNTKRLQRLIPRQTAKRLVLTGTTLSSEQAARLEIADHVCSKGQIQRDIQEFAASLQKKSPIALHYAKAAFLDVEPERAMTLSIQSKHYKEGASAFLENREPHWTK